MTILLNTNQIMLTEQTFMFMYIGIRVYFNVWFFETVQICCKEVLPSNYTCRVLPEHKLLSQGDMRRGINFSFPIVGWTNSCHLNAKEYNLIVINLQCPRKSSFLVLLPSCGLSRVSSFVVISIDIAGLVLYSTVLLQFSCF